MHLVLRFFDIEPGGTFDSDLTNEGMLLYLARNHFDSLAHSVTFSNRFTLCLWSGNEMKAFSHAQLSCEFSSRAFIAFQPNHKRDL